jgi:hypothetical protein
MKRFPLSARGHAQMQVQAYFIFGAHLICIEIIKTAIISKPEKDSSTGVDIFCLLSFQSGSSSLTGAAFRRRKLFLRAAFSRA